MRRPRTLCTVGLAMLLGASCAGTGAREAEPLPFHVAVVPVDVRETDQGSARDGKATELALALDSQRISEALVQALAERGFTRATLLEPATAEGSTWVQKATERHADLVLRADLDYHPAIRSELNDRFWLNLPLFLLGGPAGWFVNDRSYYFDARLAVELFDVQAATRTTPQVLDVDSRVFRVEREAKEATLDFLDRADGAGSYALSFLLPAGLVAKETPAVTSELEEEIVQALCDGLVGAIQERSYDVVESSELVAFHPDLAVVGSPPERRLAGELVLELGRVNRIVGTRVRFDDGDFRDHPLGEARMDSGGRQPVRRYPVSIPLGARESGTVQLEVRQEDRDSTTRTFTFEIPPSVAEP